MDKMFGNLKKISYLCNMKNTQSKHIHRNASDGSSECLLRPPPMLRITRRNASLPPIGGIPMTLREHRKGKSE